MLPAPSKNGVYHFCVTIPERIYPFATLINGKRVRWRKSYEYKLRQIERKLGKGKYGIKLAAYRESCHVLGAALFIVAATYFSNLVWGSEAALPVMFIAAMLAITYQEFYYHPMHYKQRFGKSVVDWFSWVVPIGAYFLVVLV